MRALIALAILAMAEGFMLAPCHYGIANNKAKAGHSLSLRPKAITMLPPGDCPCCVGGGDEHFGLAIVVGYAVGLYLIQILDWLLSRRR